MGLKIKKTYMTKIREIKKQNLVMVFEDYKLAVSACEWLNKDCLGKSDYSYSVCILKEMGIRKFYIERISNFELSILKTKYDDMSSYFNTHQMNEDEKYDIFNNILNIYSSKIYKKKSWAMKKSDMLNKLSTTLGYDHKFNVSSIEDIPDGFIIDVTHL